MGNRIFNFNNYILNENSKKTYEEVYDLIVKYINLTLESDIQINQYVPNTHIAKVFKDVLIFLELENMYYDDFHGEYQHKGEEWSEEGGYKEVYTTVKTDIHFLKYLENGTYFNSELLKSNTEEEIHRVYQKLREKKDEIRNNILLARIKLEHIIMPHLTKSNLDSHKIKIDA